MVADAAAISGGVVQEDAAAEGQGSRVVDATARRVRVAVGNGQAGKAHGPGLDIEDAAGAGAADRQEVGIRTEDGQGFGDVQLATGQGDRVAVEAGGEGDRVAAVGGGDGVPQGAGTAVQVVQDRQGAEQGAILQDIQPGPERRPNRTRVAA